MCLNEPIISPKHSWPLLQISVSLLSVLLLFQLYRHSVCCLLFPSGERVIEFSIPVSLLLTSTASPYSRPSSPYSEISSYLVSLQSHPWTQQLDTLSQDAVLIMSFPSSEFFCGSPLTYYYCHSNFFIIMCPLNRLRLHNVGARFLDYRAHAF